MITMNDRREDQLGNQYRKAFNQLQFDEDLAERVQQAAADRPVAPAARPARAFFRQALAIAGTLTIIVLAIIGIRWYAGRQPTTPSSSQSSAEPSVTSIATTEWSQPTSQTTSDPNLNVDRMEICRVGSNTILSIEDAGQLRRLFEALNQGYTAATISEVQNPDFTLFIFSGSQETLFTLYLEDDGCYFTQAAEPGSYFQISDASENALRIFISTVLVPYEDGRLSMGAHTTTLDLTHILKYPAADLHQFPQPAEGDGCLTAASMEALTAIMDRADGQVSVVLPTDDQLQFQEAILRARGYYEYHYQDSQTGNDLFYTAYFGRADFIADEWGMKKITLGSQTAYRNTITNRQGSTVTALHWEWQGWNLDLKIEGKTASSGDLKRYISFEQALYHPSAPPAETGTPLIGSQATIDALMAEHSGITFERHRNYFYNYDAYVESVSDEQIAQFMFGRLGSSGYYIYNFAAIGQSLSKFRVEDDGCQIMTYGGSDLRDPTFYFRCRTADHPKFTPAPQVNSPSTLTLDFGSLNSGDITYYYVIHKNYDRYLTEISWLSQGCHCSITVRDTREVEMTADRLEQLISGVRWVAR
jgi:hypothetical protein